MEKAFFFCAVLGSAFVVLQFVVLLLGLGGSDFDADGDLGDASFDADSSADGSDSASTSNHGVGGVPFLKMFSIRTLTAGVAFFGLAGLASIRAGLSQGVSLGIASASGLVAIVAVYFLMRALSSFNHDGAIRAESAKGALGTVYLRVPANRKGVGKVTIVQQERSMEYDAVTDSDVDLVQGTAIVVNSLVTPTLLAVAKRVG